MAASGQESSAKSLENSLQRAFPFNLRQQKYSEAVRGIEIETKQTTRTGADQFSEVTTN